MIKENDKNDVKKSVNHKAVAMIFVMAFLSCMMIQKCNVSAMPTFSVTAERSGSTAPKLTPDCRYKVKVNDFIGGMVFTAPETGWYSFTASNLSQKKEKYCSAWVYLQNASDIKKAKKSDYSKWYYRPFTYLYNNKNYLRSKSYICFGTKQYCNQSFIKGLKKSNKEKSYTKCEGARYIKKGTTYVLTSEMDRYDYSTYRGRAGPIRWRSGLKSSQV